MGGFWRSVKNMKTTVLYLITLVLVSCEKSEQKSGVTGANAQVSHSTSELLSPRDLGIQKESFIAKPTTEQVAIFRVEHIDARLNFLKPYNIIDAHYPACLKRYFIPCL